MEKRVLLAVALSFLVLYGYQALFPPPKPAQSTAPAPQVSGSTTPGTAAAPPPSEAEAVAPTTPQEAPLVGDREENERGEAAPDFLRELVPHR